MIDWMFQSANYAAFCADLKAFCTAKGYVNPDGSAMLVDTAPDGTLSIPVTPAGDPIARTFPDVRIDLSVQDDLAVTLPDGTVVHRGWHVNVRGSLMPQGNPLALPKLDQDIRDYFAPLSLVTHDTPAAMQTAYGVTPGQYRATTSPTKLISPAPAYPKRRFA